MSRRYGVWAGNPRGVAENTECCVKEVWPARGSMIPHQCNRKRGHGEDGLYCYQHSRSTVNIRPIRKEN